jgi:AcrR family transcriptional regulator
VADRPRPYRLGARAAAARATRDGIVDAAIERFVARPYEDVTLREIARAAGVALQTVVNHFATKEGVFAAAVERFGAQMESLRDGVAPGDLDGAVDALMAEYERSGDANIRMLELEERVAAIRPALLQGRALHRDWVERVFGAGLGDRGGAARERRLAAFLAATDVYVWKRLRRDEGLTREQTAAVLRELLQALCGDGR